MRYELRCEHCGGHTETHRFVGIGHTANAGCPRCGGLLRRVASSPYFRQDTPAHYNVSIGKHVTNNTEYRSELSRKADEQAERLGTDVKYNVWDTRDPEACGVDDPEVKERAQRATQ